MLSLFAEISSKSYIFALVKTDAELNTRTIVSFDQVYLDNFERLCYHAFSIVGDEDDAKDIVNNVFCFLYEEWAKYSARPLEAFLLTLVHNASIDHTRRVHTRRRYEQYILQHEDEVEQFSNHEERVQRVVDAINEMPEQMRRVFTGCYLEGKKYQEVADEMHVSINTVKTNINRGLKNLRKKLSDVEFVLLFVALGHII